MPVADKKTTIIEDGQRFDGQTVIKPISINFEILQEIHENLDKIKRYEEEIKEDKRRIEKANDAIRLAHEMVAKAEEKRNSLLRRNQVFKKNVEDTENRVKQALEYWKEYGIDIKEISTNHYEFIYTKLKVSIGLKFDDKQLKVVSQDREVISPDSMNELNSRLTNNCVHADGTNVDYKLAMITIKKELMKNLSTT